MPERGEAWEEGFLSAHGFIVTVMVGKAWCQEWEADGHTVPVAKRDECWSSCRFSLAVQYRVPDMEWHHHI